MSSARRPWVKICGVTRPTDAECAARLGADFLGLNFWPGSPRRVAVEAARDIAASARGAVQAGAIRLVGVFVNESPGRVDERAAELALDLVQLHGDEPETELVRWGERLVRVVRGGLSLRQNASASTSAPSPHSGEAPFAYLLDAPRAAGAAYGGRGEAWEWGTARGWVAACGRPVLIAGGVRPENVAAALAASGAAGVDVASGVESAPGIKDVGRMRRLMEEVRGAHR